MKVSTISIDITPHNEVKLCGYINDVRNHQRTKIAHDPIYAIAIRMVTESKDLLFISLDVLSITKSRAEEIKKAIVDKYNFETESIFINAIHTHSGPSGFSVDAMGKEYEDNVEYRTSAIERIVKGVGSLFGNEQDVQGYIGKTKINGFYDNRNNKNAYFDDEAIFIKFVNKQEKIIASFVNFNVHSTVLGPMNMEISYDLIGAVRENLFDSLGVHPFVCIGTSADISNRHFRQGDDFKELDRVSKGITEQLLNIHNYEEIDMNIVEIKDFHYRLKYDNRKNHSFYQNELEKIKLELEHSDDKTKQKLLLSSKDKYQSKLKIDKVDKDICCRILKFPKIEIVTFPGELTSVFGRFIKQQSRCENTLIITCCNDHHGYFIEESQFGKCYESTATLIPKGETEKIIKELGNYL
ncbi:MAG: neutral/alkaline non-lysosomal ceramidase N-terminal domain-containing protein [Clostridium sp.]